MILKALNKNIFFVTIVFYALGSFYNYIYYNSFEINIFRYADFSEFIINAFYILIWITLFMTLHNVLKYAIKFVYRKMRSRMNFVDSRKNFFRDFLDFIIPFCLSLLIFEFYYDSQNLMSLFKTFLSALITGGCVFMIQTLYYGISKKNNHSFDMESLIGSIFLLFASVYVFALLDVRIRIRQAHQEGQFISWEYDNKLYNTSKTNYIIGESHDYLFQVKYVGEDSIFVQTFYKPEIKNYRKEILESGISDFSFFGGQ